jgi:hypothetical protein
VSTLESYFNILAFTIRGMDDAEGIVKHVPDLLLYRYNRTDTLPVYTNLFIFFFSFMLF